MIYKARGVVGPGRCGGRAGGAVPSVHTGPDAEARLRRFQAAIAAGVDPNALVEVINAARAERRAAQATLTTRPRRMTRLATCQLRFRCG
jgi:hypothetical protein